MKNSGCFLSVHASLRCSSPPPSRSDTHADRVETLRERVCRFNAANTLPGDSSVTRGRKHRLDLSLSPPRAGAAGHAKGEQSCVKGWTVEE